MEKDEWLRYSCQLALPDFGEGGQLKLQQSKVLIVGVGGIGCPAALYLTASGVGKIGIADFDVISISNLHRQVLFSPVDIGLLKAEVACKKLSQQNPQISLVPIIERITSENVMRLICDYDIVVDSTDNFETKYLLNDACVLSGKPMVYAAIYRYEGQVSMLNVMNRDGTYSPNYRDLFPEVNAALFPSCSEAGVIPTIAGISGCIQANEVLKWITGSDNLLVGKLLVIDAKTMQSKAIHTGVVTRSIIAKLPESITIGLISTWDLKNNLDKNVYELFDVRNEEERRKYNIGGRHIPLLEIEASISLLYYDKPVVFYCESGRRSAEAAKIAKKKYPQSDYFSLEGGMRAWKEMEISLRLLAE